VKEVKNVYCLDIMEWFLLEFIEKILWTYSICIYASCRVSIVEEICGS